MSVTLKAADEFGVASSTTPANLLAYLQHLGISVPDPKAIEVMAGADGCIRPTEDVVLAKGRPAVPQRRGRIELLVGTEQAGDDPTTSLNHRRPSGRQSGPLIVVVAGGLFALSLLRRAAE